MENRPKTVLLAGASGVVGSAVLAQLLADGSVGQVIAVLRRPLPNLSANAQHPKLLQRICPNLLAMPVNLCADVQVDECYIALGSTIKAAGSREAFRQVDYDAVLAVASVAQAAGCTRVAVVSALESNAKSAVFYSRVKGEMEQGLVAMGFARLVIARPSIIDGDRAALGQAHRRGEDIALRVMHALGWLIPRAYAPITGRTIAAAMVQGLRAEGTEGAAGEPVAILRSGQMQALAKQQA
jgi:uncharacterized protein YbjT (DUF2867 family)